MSSNVYLICGLGILAAILLLLMYLLLRRIRREDPRLFDRLGSPDLISNNTLAHAGKLWSWLYSTGKDNAISGGTRAIVWVMRVLVPMYLTLFIGMIIRSVSSG